MERRQGGLESSSRTVGRPKKDEAERVIQRILDAAAVEFSSRGYLLANADTIAMRADVSKATIYRHFTGKDQLLQAVTRRWVEQILEQEHPSLDPQAEIADELRRYALSALELITRDGEAFAARRSVAKMAMTEIELFPDTVENSRLRTMGKYIDPLREYFEALIQQGRMRPFDTARAADMFYRLNYPLMDLRRGSLDAPSARVEFVEFMIDMFLKGCLPSR